MSNAIEKVNERSLRAARALDQAAVPYGVIEVGLVDASWLPRLPEALRSRLQELLDTPEG